MKNPITKILIIMAMNCTAFSATLYVNLNAGGGNNGANWTNAYTSFQTALDNAISTDEIWIAKGTYYPSSAYDLTDSPRYYHFRLKNGVVIYGGFAGTESAVSERTDFGVGGVNETILSGDIGTIDDDSDNCYHIFYHPDGIYLDATAILDGVTITGSKADGAGDHIYGGGMYNYTCTPVLNKVNFVNNWAYHAGGMYNGRSSLTLTNCIFTGNYGYMYGGAIFNVASSPTITNCLICDNSTSSRGYGAGIYGSSTSMVLNNVTFTGNSTETGGGLYLTSSDPTLNNCIIWGNTATANGSELYIADNETVLNYCCYGNDAGDIYNDGTLTPDGNCMTSDPCFVGSANNAAHPYSIGGISPCADAGNDAYCSESIDIRGYTRKLDKSTGEAGTIDMGVYEYKVGSDAALPVELVSFAAEWTNGSVELTWSTASESDNLGFIIERRSGNGQWRQIASYLTHHELTGQGTTSALTLYTFNDTGTNAGMEYTYRLSDVSSNGEIAELFTASAEAAVTPSLTQLLAAYPNPFNPQTCIPYQLSQDSQVEISIYDVLGRQVRTLIDQHQYAGSYKTWWNGMDDAGHPLPSGAYIVRMQTGKASQTNKVLYIK